LSSPKGSHHNVVDAAEQAAAVGDLDAASELLRQAVQLQEAELGPHHADLANTLNNLGVVCEKTGRLDEAAACYRRAYDIAAASFEPGHPFVITSRKNLAEFCEAHGRPFERPSAPEAAASPSLQEAASSPTVEPTRKHAQPAANHRRFQVAIPGALLVGLVVVLVLGAVIMRRSSGPPASTTPTPSPAASTAIESAGQRDVSADSRTPAATEPGNASKEATPRSTNPGRGPVGSQEAVPAGSARAAAQPTVAEAQVCRRFSTAGSPDWRCDRAGSSVSPGSLVYYTRIKAPKATTVEHRWYRGDELQQRVLLDVAANPTAGYRTYSRLAVSATGGWRVELRTATGTLLHEERFSVR
jgi:hypothetical protein